MGIFHRTDSIQGTDYIAMTIYHPLVLNLRVSRTEIENLR